MTRPSQRALDLATLGLEELNGQIGRAPPAGTSPHDVDRVFVRHKAPLLGALAKLLEAAIQSASEPASPSPSRSKCRPVVTAHGPATRSGSRLANRRRHPARTCSQGGLRCARTAWCPAGTRPINLALMRNHRMPRAPRMGRHIGWFT